MFKWGYIPAIFALVFLSCRTETKQTFISNLEHLVADVDANYTHYSEEEWQNADEQFDELKDNEFLLWEDSMDDEEKGKVHKLIGKYEGIKLKKNVDDLKDQIKDTAEQAGEIINELLADTTRNK